MDVIHGHNSAMSWLLFLLSSSSSLTFCVFLSIVVLLDVPFLQQCFEGSAHGGVWTEHHHNFNGQVLFKHPSFGGIGGSIMVVSRISSFTRPFFGFVNILVCLLLHGSWFIPQLPIVLNKFFQLDVLCCSTP